MEWTHYPLVFHGEPDHGRDPTGGVRNFLEIPVLRGIELAFFEEFEVANLHRELVVDIMAGDTGEVVELPVCLAECFFWKKSRV